MHLNPVRAKMVEAPEEYSWSSYNYYIGKEKPIAWLAIGLILGYFGKKLISAPKGYMEFVTSLVNEKYDNPLDGVSQANRRLNEKFKSDKKLRRKIGKIETTLNL